MSRHDPRAYLHDIVEACDGIGEVLGGADVAFYVADRKTRLAVERELITLGEAVARLSETSPELVADWAVPIRSIIGLRNLLVHGYFNVDDSRVFETACGEVPAVRSEAARALQTLLGS